MSNYEILCNNRIPQHPLVYVTYIIHNVIDVLRTIAFMGLERNCPLNHDRFCCFLSSHVSPSPYPSCFVIRAISRPSNLAVGSQVYGRETWHVEAISACSDKQFVCREEQTGGRNSEKGTPFAFSCRTGFFSIPLIVRRLNETAK